MNGSIVERIVNKLICFIREIKRKFNREMKAVEHIQGKAPDKP